MTRKESEARALELKYYRNILINYMYEKIKAKDWHAVADVAMDLREVELEISIREEAL